MRVVRFSPTASSDLDEIWTHLAEVASPELARTVNRRLKDRLKTLARWPYLGTVVSAKPRFRKYPVPPFLVLYRPIEMGVEIARIVHGKRDLREILEDL